MKGAFLGVINEPCSRQTVEPSFSSATQVRQYRTHKDIDEWFAAEGAVLIITFKQVQLLAPVTKAKKEMLRTDEAALKKQAVCEELMFPLSQLFLAQAHA